MSLYGLDLKYTYRSSSDKIHKDFYYPCLLKAKKYDRAVGYFTSNSLSVLADGLDEFIEKDGKIRLVANPYLTKDDVEAIELGYKAKYDVITESLLREVKLTEEMIKQDSLYTLAWLIYKDKLEIKIAFTNNNSLYHEKFGIFYDDLNNKIAFSGSANETVGGILENFEKIDVFWKESDQERIKEMANDFEKLWNDETPQLSIVEIPDIIKERLAEYRISTGKRKSKAREIKPRPYQGEAITALEKNQWHGILEMATGTGKTITSLLAAHQFYQEKGEIFLVIIVPFTHLATQWGEELEQMDFPHVTNCYGNKKNWVNKLQTDVRDFNAKIMSRHVAITTYRTAASKEFNDLIHRIRNNSFLIADECHYFGVRSLRKNKLDQMTAKVGLSATPSRWWDEEGTGYLQDFFGSVVYEYSMREAIQNGALTEYSYHPIQVDFTEDELGLYEYYTKKLISLYEDKKASEDEISELNRKRSMVISKASQKKEVLLNIFQQKQRADVSHTLVYCAPGEVNEMTKGLSDLGYRVHRFNSEVELKERTKILESFAKGSIQILVAIKCLDEGVDVPSTREAYFLSSTSNPREFIQRRGRILRTHEDKTIAKIHDFIVLPRLATESMYKLIASKELPRFAEFSQYAINNYMARNDIKRFLTPYNLDYLMDKTPWEVYAEFQALEEER